MAGPKFWKLELNPVVRCESVETFPLVRNVSVRMSRISWLSKVPFTKLPEIVSVFLLLMK